MEGRHTEAASLGSLPSLQCIGHSTRLCIDGHAAIVVGSRRGNGERVWQWSRCGRHDALWPRCCTVAGPVESIDMDTGRGHAIAVWLDQEQKRSLQWYHALQLRGAEQMGADLTRRVIAQCQKL